MDYFFNRRLAILMLSSILQAGCVPLLAPLMGPPPPIPLFVGAHSQLGFGGFSGQTLHVIAKVPEEIIGGGGFWYLGRVNSRFDMGFFHEWSNVNVSSTGIVLRPHLFDGEHLHVAIDIRAGFAFADIGLSLAVRLARPVYLYTGPSIGVGLSQAPYFARMPVGVAFVLSPIVLLLLEGSAHFRFANREYVAPPDSVEDIDGPPTWAFVGFAGLNFRF